MVVFDDGNEYGIAVEQIVPENTSCRLSNYGFAHRGRAREQRDADGERWLSSLLSGGQNVSPR